MADATVRMSDRFTAWIQSVHAALEPTARELQSARWGPVTMRHRTTRHEWFAAMDRAWALPIDVGTDVDLISAAIADVPPEIPAPWLRGDEVGVRGEVPIEAGSSTRMTWIPQRGRILAWHPQSRAAILLHARPPEEDDLVSPVKDLVHWVTARAGGFIVHGAAIGRVHDAGTRGVLLLGESGYGKSTTTLACLQKGWRTCGDDAVVVYDDAAGWHAHAIYAAIKTKLNCLAPADLDVMALGTKTWDIGGVKRAHLLSTAQEQLLAASIDLGAVVLLDPEAQSEDPVEPVSPARARNVTAPTMILLMPFDSAIVLRRLGRMLSDLPVARLPRRSAMAQTVADVTRIADDSEPFVSVIIPLYDGRDLVADAIASVLAQTVGRFEIVAVNDASPDDSLAVVESLRGTIEAAGHELVTIDLPANTGIGGARSAGMRVATGAYIAWLDQDDLWPRDRTAVLWAAMRRQYADVIAGRMHFEDLAPHAPRPWMREQWLSQYSHPGLALGSMFCRSEVLDVVGLPDETFRTGSDDVEWIMRARSSPVTFSTIPEVTLVRRLHTRNQSRRASSAEMIAAVRAHVNRQRAQP